MSSIGSRSKEQFAADFPIDLGSGVRGAPLRDHDAPIGLIIAHQLDDGHSTCGGVVFWEPGYSENVWTVDREDPLCLSPSIQCTCGIHGYIKEGAWVPV